jgi:hypothetical protein
MTQTHHRPLTAVRPSLTIAMLRLRGLSMRTWRQARQAVVWGCLGVFSSCPYFDVRSNALPLQFGMTPDAASAALSAPLTYVSGRKGSEVFYAERTTAIPSFFTYDRQVWLQFRNGHLTGWHNDWRRTGLW